MDRAAEDQSEIFGPYNFINERSRTRTEEQKKNYFRWFQSVSVLGTTADSLDVLHERALESSKHGQRHLLSEVCRFRCPFLARGPGAYDNKIVFLGIHV